MKDEFAEAQVRQRLKIEARIISELVEMQGFLRPTVVAELPDGKHAMLLVEVDEAKQEEWKRVVRYSLEFMALSGARYLMLFCEAWQVMALDATGAQAVDRWKAEKGTLAEFPGRREVVTITVGCPAETVSGVMEMHREDGRVRVGRLEVEQPTKEKRNRFFDELPWVRS